MNEQQKLFAKLRDITRNLMTEGPRAATAAIQKALQGAHNMPGTGTGTGAHAAGSNTGLQEPVLHDINPPPAGKSANPPAGDGTGEAPQPAARARPRAGAADEHTRQRAATAADGMAGFVPDLLAKLGVHVDGAGLGLGKMPGRQAVPLPEGAQFLAGSYTNQAGTRKYKLYVPAAWSGQPLPLVVMLHGCTQDPDDFAAGTQMNAVAESQPCLVLYPQQSQGDNSSRCWNWFNAGDQQRDAGEPSIIAGMTREVALKYQVDQRQVYVAGLSAGGAMAAIMGTTYPDLYAGVAVHSGLPYGAATDLPSALAAMRSGVSGATPRPRQAHGAPAFKGVPIIVFHGDADHTVNVRNGEQVLRGAAPATAVGTGKTQEQGKVTNGHAYTRTVHTNAHGKAVAEHWLIHGFGHAWAGGSPDGSYTDARGPDATGEMMRFFSTQSQPA